MNRDETLALLRARSALTSQPYGDEAIDAWLDALGDCSYVEARAALVRAARERSRVTVADIHERIPNHNTIPAMATPHHCELCDGSGWLEADTVRAEDHACRPCRCSLGQQFAKRYGLTTPDPPPVIDIDDGRLDLF